MNETCDTCAFSELSKPNANHDTYYYCAKTQMMTGFHGVIVNVKERKVIVGFKKGKGIVKQCNEWTEVEEAKILNKEW